MLSLIYLQPNCSIDTLIEYHMRIISEKTTALAFLLRVPKSILDSTVE
jgi:hypothetical protein